MWVQRESASLSWQIREAADGSKTHSIQETTQKKALNVHGHTHTYKTDRLRNKLGTESPIWPVAKTCTQWIQTLEIK